MSDILHAWNVTCQAWNLKSCLPTGFHAWKAKSHDWTLMSGIPTGLLECQIPCLESDVRLTYWPA